MRKLKIDDAIRIVTECHEALLKDRAEMTAKAANHKRAGGMKWKLGLNPFKWHREWDFTESFKSAFDREWNTIYLDHVHVNEVPLYDMVVIFLEELKNFKEEGRKTVMVEPNFHAVLMNPERWVWWANVIRLKD